MRPLVATFACALAACGATSEPAGDAGTDSDTSTEGDDDDDDADGTVGSSDDDDDDDDDDDGQTGMEVYLSLCAPCHGPEGEGTELGYELRHPDRPFSTWVIRNGRPGDEFPDASMAAFAPEAVSDAQLEEIYDWLDGFPQPVGGEALYMDYCRNCHGVDPFEGGVVGKEIGDKDLDDSLEKVREGEGGSDYGNRIMYMSAFDETVLSDDEVMAITDWFDTL